MKLLYIIIALICTVFFGIITVERLFLYLQYKNYLYFVGSLFLCGLLFLKFMSPGNYYSIQRHEKCHEFGAIITFRKPMEINVNQNGGHFCYNGKANIILKLAPYFLPLTTVLLLIIRLLVAKVFPLFFVLLGASLAFDLNSMFKDYHTKQSDWQQYGIRFSYTFSAIMAVLFVFTILTFVFGGYHEWWKVATQACRLGKELLTKLY